MTVSREQYMGNGAHYVSKTQECVVVMLINEFHA